MMRDPIEYFLSAEITLSDKLLEVLYLIIGLICIYTAIANLRDKRNQKRYGTFVFWCTLGLMFVLGPWIPSLYTGILMCVMVAVPILHRVSRGTQPDPSEEEAEKNYRKIGMRKANAISKLSLSVAAVVKDGEILDFRAASGAAGPRVIRSRDAENLLKGHKTEEIPEIQESFLDSWNNAISPHAMPLYRRNTTRRMLSYFLSAIYSGKAEGIIERRTES